jgi:hypothetical protein
MWALIYSTPLDIGGYNKGFLVAPSFSLHFSYYDDDKEVVRTMEDLDSSYPNEATFFRRLAAGKEEFEWLFRLLIVERMKAVYGQRLNVVFANVGSNS